MKVSSTKHNLLSSVRQLTREKWALGATIFTGKMIGLIAGICRNDDFARLCWYIG
jgi:hypothetical protein